MHICGGDVGSRVGQRKYKLSFCCPPKYLHMRCLHLTFRAHRVNPLVHNLRSFLTRSEDLDSGTQQTILIYPGAAIVLRITCWCSR